MNANRYSRWIAISLSAILIHVSCSFSVSLTSPPPSPTVPPQATDTQQTPTEPTETAIVPPTSTDEVDQETAIIAATSASTCTVLQDLNLRFGPGTAYRPPIQALPANTVVTPLGFAPQGIPGGSWAYVQTANQEQGWVSAGSQYISCNIELASLPPVEFGTPPPPPLPKTAQTSDPDGNGFCIDPDSGIRCVGTFDKESLFQFQMFSNGAELGENEVEKVNFVVRKLQGDDVYRKDESTPAYCVFGGNGPCNPWVYENGVLVWTQGGPPVEAGEYEMEANTTLKDGQTSRWAVNFKLTLP